MEIPATAGEITAEWLDAALEHSGSSQGKRVVSLRQEPLTELGMTGTLLRLHVDYEGGAGDAPATLIAKLPDPESTGYEMAMAMGFYACEGRFFDELADDCGVSVPHVHYNGIDEEAKRFLLLLEDLAPARTVALPASCSVDDARCALGELAKLHARYWDSPKLQQLEWMRSLADPAFGGFVRDLSRSQWPVLMEQQGKTMPAMPEALRRAGDRYMESIDDLWSIQSPQTVNHGDFHVGNMIFEARGGDCPLAIIDWQLMVRRGALPDVSYALAFSLEANDRRDHEDALLADYHRALVEHGVTGFSLDDCRYFYKLGVLAQFALMALHMMNVANASDRDLHITRELHRRAHAALLETGALDVLSDV